MSFIVTALLGIYLVPKLQNNGNEIRVAMFVSMQFAFNKILKYYHVVMPA